MSGVAVRSEVDGAATGDRWLDIFGYIVVRRVICGSVSGAITGIHFTDQHAKRIATKLKESSVSISSLLVE